jgi:hypothetical protein
LRAQTTQVLDHADRYPNSFDQLHDLAAQHLIAIHVRGRDEEISVAPIGSPLQAAVGFVLERHALAADPHRKMLWPQRIGACGSISRTRRGAAVMLLFCGRLAFCRASIISYPIA